MGELQHYGVLGMKWGIRRERTTGKAYTYKSHGTKKQERKETQSLARASAANAVGNTARANKFTEKAAVYNYRKTKSQEFDKAEETFARNSRTGRVIVASILTGGVANRAIKGYTRGQALNGSKAGNFVSGVAAAYLGVPYNAAIKAFGVRSGEPKPKR